MDTRRMRHFFSVLLVFIPSSVWADVTDTPTQRQLSLPTAAWKLALPREDWVITKEQRRPGDTAVYYMLASEKRQLVFSVYIDQTAACASSVSCLDAALKNPAYKDAKDLSKSTVGQYSVESFFLDQPQGYPVKQAHVLAETFSDGYWIDIHISKTSKEKPDQASLLELLDAVKVIGNER